MTVDDLKELLNDVPNNFEFEVDVIKPYSTERCVTDKGDYDISWIDKKIKINVKIK